MARPCFVCDGKRAHPIHVKAVGMAGYHPYQDSSAPGLKPLSEGMRNYRQESGYDAAVREAKGTPCQIVSPVCSGTAEHLHEPLSRGRAGGLKAAVRGGGTVPSCDNCNGYIAENPVWAKEHGWLFSATIEGRAAAKEAKATRNPEQEPAIVKVRRDPYSNGKNDNGGISEVADSQQDRKPCIGNDPACPCQDGDPCHYLPYDGTAAMPIPRRKHTTTEESAVPKSPGRSRSRLRGK